MDWLLYDTDLLHETVKRGFQAGCSLCIFQRLAVGVPRILVNVSFRNSLFCNTIHRYRKSQSQASQCRAMQSSAVAKIQIQSCSVLSIKQSHRHSISAAHSFKICYCGKCVSLYIILI